MIYRAGDHGIHLIDRSDERLRRSRELSAKSHGHVSRSHDLVLQSKALLAQDPGPVPCHQAHEVEAVLATQFVDTEESPHDLLQTVSGKRIEGQLLNMDGKHFIGCEILDCTLQYSGLPMVVESTHFRGCGFQFTGSASLTVRFLECFELLAESRRNYVLASDASTSGRPN